MSAPRVLALVKATERLQQHEREGRAARADARQAQRAAEELLVERLADARCDVVEAPPGADGTRQVLRVTAAPVKYQKLCTAEDVIRFAEEPVLKAAQSCAAQHAVDEAVRVFTESARRPGPPAPPRIRVVRAPSRGAASAPPAPPTAEIERLGKMFFEAKQQTEQANRTVAPLRKAVKEAECAAAPLVTGGAVAVRVSDGTTAKTVSVALAPPARAAGTKPIGYRAACRCVREAATYAIAAGSGAFHAAAYQRRLRQLLQQEFEARQQTPSTAPPPRAKVSTRAAKV